MSLEDKIQALTEALEANTQVLIDIKAVKVEAFKVAAVKAEAFKVAAVKVEAVVEPVAAVKVVAEPVAAVGADKPLTLDDVSLKLTELLQVKGRDVAVRILGKHNAKSVSYVKDLNAFLADVLQALRA